MRYLMPLMLLWAAPVSADLILNYSGFYGRMKKLQQPEYSDITLAFALVGEKSGTPCQYYRIRLHSDRHDIALDVADNGEISLPYDEALKDSNALLQVLQADNVEACQIEFRLRSRMRLPAELSLTQLQHYRSQFDLLLDDMAGLGKHWLPPVSGVIVEFAQDINLPASGGQMANATRCQGNRCYIDLSQTLPDESQWHFQQRPLHLLPLLNARAE